MAVYATCEHDTGAALDCRPACDEPATTAVTHWVDGLGVRVSSMLCARHTRTRIHRVGAGLIDTIVQL